MDAITQSFVEAQAPKFTVSSTDAEGRPFTTSPRAESSARAYAAELREMGRKAKVQRHE